MMKSSPPAKRTRALWLWISLVVVLVVLVPATVFILPVLNQQNQGTSGQEISGDQWPTMVTAQGADGRDRVLSVAAAENSVALDTSQVAEGDRVIVTGTGFDAGQGIYVAVCVIPEKPTTKPGPCLGGVPAQEQQDVEAGTIQYAPSNWINDDWAWRLFGARGFDDVELGSFTAYLEMPNPVGEEVDCTVDACGIYTRNDHTALRDRVQDVYIPVRFAEAK
ncbi:MAG: hypothetical protein ACOH1J_07925 [Microbacteriaceae bacterium]